MAERVTVEISPMDSWPAAVDAHHVGGRAADQGTLRDGRSVSEQNRQRLDVDATHQPDPLLNMVLTDVYWDVDVRCWLQQTWALTRTVAHRSAFRNIYCANIVADSNAAPLRLRWDRWRSPRSSRRDLTLSVGR